MTEVKVSPKYQVVIPLEVRKRLSIRPGDKVQVLVDGERLVLVAKRPIRKLRGFVPGIDTRAPRDKDRV